MGYTAFQNGFNIQTASAIDKRIFLTKAEMLTAEEDYMLPDVYICICPDDGKFYIYNVNNTASATTGKYRLIDEQVLQNSSAFEQALENSNKISSIESRVGQNETDISALETRVDGLTITQLSGTLDGGLVQE